MLIIIDEYLARPGATHSTISNTLLEYSLSDYRYCSHIKPFFIVESMTASLSADDRIKMKISLSIYNERRRINKDVIEPVSTPALSLQ